MRGRAWPLKVGGKGVLQKRNLLVVAIAILFGLAAVWLANTYFGAIESQANVQAASPQATVKILAAKQDLGFGDKITNENAHLVDWPTTSVPQGSVTAEQAQAFISANNAAVRSLVAGEPILQSRTSRGGLLSANLPANQRAVSIPIDFVTGVSGFVKPGDIVDVVLTRAIPGSNATADEQMASIILQNVAVLAIDVTASDKPAEQLIEPPKSDKLPEFKSATLMVDALGAQKLALASQLGKLILVLRNANDRTPTTVAALLPRDLGGGGLRVAPTTKGATPALRSSATRRSAPASLVVPPPYRPTMLVTRGTQESVESVVTNGY